MFKIFSIPSLNLFSNSLKDHDRNRNDSVKFKCLKIDTRRLSSDTFASQTSRKTSTESYEIHSNKANEREKSDSLSTSNIQTVSIKKDTKNILSIVKDVELENKSSQDCSALSKVQHARLVKAIVTNVFPKEPQLMMGTLSKRDTNLFFWTTCFITLDRGFVCCFDRASQCIPLKYPYGNRLISRYLLTNSKLLISKEQNIMITLSKEPKAATRWVKLFCHIETESVDVYSYPDFKTAVVGKLKNEDEFEIFNKISKGFYFCADGRVSLDFI